MGQVELPQLTQEVHPLLSLFDNGVHVVVPLQVLGDDGSQKLEGFHSRHGVVEDGDGGHCHLHSFERVELQVVLTAPEGQLSRL